MDGVGGIGRRRLQRWGVNLRSIDTHRRGGDGRSLQVPRFSFPFSFFFGVSGSFFFYSFLGARQSFVGVGVGFQWVERLSGSGYGLGSSASSVV